MKLITHQFNYNVITNERARTCVCLQECVCVYMLDGFSRLLSEDPPHELPREGKIRCVTLCVSLCACDCVRRRGSCSGKRKR